MKMVEKKNTMVILAEHICVFGEYFVFFKSILCIFVFFGFFLYFECILYSGDSELIHSMTQPISIIINIEPLEK